MRVQADDLTVRPGEHFAQTLRRGTYQLKQDQAGKWQIASYAKEYDSADEKGQDKQASTPLTEPSPVVSQGLSFEASESLPWPVTMSAGERTGRAVPAAPGGGMTRHP
ncbi:MAG TPA: hypothetical protein VJ324_08495 [Candidatus Acidoferrum sp.]|nr:hypothetical protein [Candidatus Acidoferrum sp.]